MSGGAIPGAFNDSPLGATPPTAVTALTAAWNTPNIDLTWVDPGTVIAGSAIRLWVRTHENIVHKQLMPAVVLTDQADAIAQVRGAQGAWLQVIDTPGHYIFQADCIQPNELKSPPSLSVEVTVT